MADEPYIVVYQRKRKGFCVSVDMTVNDERLCVYRMGKFDTAGQARQFGEDLVAEWQKR